MNTQLLLPGITPERRPPIPLLEAFAHPFDLAVIDPPWPYQNWTEKKNGAAVAHYPLMSLEEIKALPVPDVLVRDAAVGLWTTGPKDGDAHDLLRHWGLRFITVQFVWLKTTRAGAPVFGPGWHAASSCEFMHWAVKGNGLARAAVREPQVITGEESLEPELLATVRAPRSHSTKPPEVLARLERMYPQANRRLEMFARRLRHGWLAWGDEVGPWEPPEEAQNDPRGDAQKSAGSHPAANTFAVRAQNENPAIEPQRLT